MPMPKRGGRGKGAEKRANNFVTVWCPTQRAGEFERMARVSERTATRMVLSGSARWDREYDGKIIGVVLNDTVLTEEMEADPGFRPRLIRRGGEDGISVVWEVGYAPSMRLAGSLIERALHDAMPGATSHHQSAGHTPVPASAG